MSLITNLRLFWLNDPAIAALVDQRIHYGHVPQKFLGPYLWFQRSGAEPDPYRTIDEPHGKEYEFEELYDVEAVDLSPEGSEALGSLVRKWNNYCHNVLGLGTVQAIFVTDANDIYQPYNIGGDDGRHVSSVRITILGYGE